MYFLMITKTMHFSPQKTDHCVLCGKEPLVGSFWQQLKLVLNLKLIIKLAPSHCCSCTRPTLSSIYLPASFSASPAFSFSCLSARLLYLPMCQTKNIHSHGWICSISRYIQQNIIKKPTGVQASSEELLKRISAIVPGGKQRKRASWKAQDLIWGIRLKTKKGFCLGTEPSTKNRLTDGESNQRWFEPLPQRGPASSLTARPITSYCFIQK